MSVTIRAAGAGDERALAVLNGFVQELHVAHRPHEFKAADVAEVSAWFGPLLTKPTVLIRLAQGAGRPVGYVAAFLHDRPENPFAPARRWCEIDQIAVEPAWRRRGVARALIETVLNEARARDIGCWRHRALRRGGELARGAAHRRGPTPRRPRPSPSASACQWRRPRRGRPSSCCPSCRPSCRRPALPRDRPARAGPRGRRHRGGSRP